ncbi:hypothetical protein, partial [Moorena sp. SIO4A5]|uniref:hypothetical protein n=1 Tax=Moorena sp. SIO4A5 TaxID=2607838 RepID=UPI0025E59E30
AKGGSPHEQLPWFPPLAQSMADSDALREWGKPPRPRCIAVSHALREWFEVTVRQARLNQ